MFFRGLRFAMFWMFQASGFADALFMLGGCCSFGVLGARLIEGFAFAIVLTVWGLSVLLKHRFCDFGSVLVGSVGSHCFSGLGFACVFVA